MTKPKSGPVAPAHSSGPELTELAAARLEGAIAALDMANKVNQGLRVRMLKQLKEGKAYQLLNMTWEEFCPNRLGISRRTADEDIMFFDRLGEGFMEAAQRLDLGRGQLRLLSSASGAILPRVEGDKLVVGEAVVPLADTAAVKDLVESVIEENLRLKEREQLGKEQLEHAEERARGFQVELKTLEDRASGRIATPFDQAIGLALQHLGRAVDMLNDPDETARPTQGTVRRWMTAVQVHMADMLTYCTGYIPPEWTRSQEALEAHLASFTGEEEDEFGVAGGVELDDDLEIT